jgi:adenine-specific DNA methylase
MSEDNITPQELEAYAFMMTWVDAGRGLDKKLVEKIRDQMYKIMEDKDGNVITYASRKEDIKKYTKYSLLVINKVLELIEAIELRTEAAKEAKDSFLTSIIMWNTMNRNNDGN